MQINCIISQTFRLVDMVGSFLIEVKPKYFIVHRMWRNSYSH